MRNAAMLVLVFYFFQNMLYVTFYGRFSFSFSPTKWYLRKYAVVGCKVYGDVWVHVYAFWVHVYAFWVHVYASVGCMYAVVVCEVNGDVRVQSIYLLGASLIRLKACLIVGSLPDSR